MGTHRPTSGAGKDTTNGMQARRSCNQGFYFPVASAQAPPPFPPSPFLFCRAKEEGREARGRCGSYLWSKCLMMEGCGLALSSSHHSNTLCYMVHKENSLREGKVRRGRVRQPQIQCGKVATTQGRGQKPDRTVRVSRKMDLME